MKKVLLVVVVVALVGGGGYVAWTQLQARGETPATPLEAPPESAASDAAATPVAAEPAAPVGPLDLALGCRVTPAAGWQVAEDAPEQKVVPGGQAVVLRKGAGDKLPVLILGVLTPEILGQIEPQTYPATFVSSLRRRVGKLVPAPTVVRSGPLATLPKLLTVGEELVLTGSFADLGVERGAGRFVAGLGADQKVYLAIGFAAEGQPETADLDAMIASLEPTGGAPAEPAGSAPAAAPAEAPVAAPPVAPGSAAPAGPAAAPPAAPGAAAPAGPGAAPAEAPPASPGAAAAPPTSPGPAPGHGSAPTGGVTPQPPAPATPAPKPGA